MGTGYNVYPLTEKLIEQALHVPLMQMALDEAGFKSPMLVNDGRYPRYDEILAVAQSIPGYRVTSFLGEKDWQISIDEDVPIVDGIFSGQWVILDSWDYTGGESGFCVYRGCMEAIVLILSHLARLYGPFLVEHELGMAYILITSETPPDAQWTYEECSEEEEIEDEL